MTEETKKERKNFRLTDEEIELIKSTFKNGEELLLALEHIFLQVPLNAIELSLFQIGIGKNKLVHKSLKKIFLPELNDMGIYFGGTRDHLMSLNFENMPSMDFVLRVKAMKEVDAYLRQQLKSIEEQNFDKPQKIKLNDLADTKNKIEADIYIDVFARNMIIALIQQGTMLLYSMANVKEKTKEEIEKQMEQDSSK
jgi:hypothetical protein